MRRRWFILQRVWPFDGWKSHWEVVRVFEYTTSWYRYSNESQRFVIPSFILSALCMSSLIPPTKSSCLPPFTPALLTPDFTTAHTGKQHKVFFNVWNFLLLAFPEKICKFLDMTTTLLKFTENSYFFYLSPPGSPLFSRFLANLPGKFPLFLLNFHWYPQQRGLRVFSGKARNKAFKAVQLLL